MMLRNLLKKIQLPFSRPHPVKRRSPDPEQSMALSLALFRYGLDAYRHGYEAKSFDPRQTIAGSVVALHDILTALEYTSIHEEVMKQCIGTQLLLASPESTIH